MTKQQYLEQLFSTMGQLRKLFESHAQESHEERATTLMQYSALKFLNTTKHSTVGDMAVCLRLSKSSATQLIERLVKGGLSLGFIIIILDTTILNVSLRTIINDLHTDIQSIQWVITAYSLMLFSFFQW